MSTIETIDGTLKSDGSLDLDQKPTIGPGRVRVLLQPVPTGPTKGGLAEVIDEIHRDQQARGFIGRSTEEIDADLHGGEEEYDQKMESLCIGSDPGEA